MKIKKFNESVSNWTESKIREMCDDHGDLGALILNYLEINHLDLFKIDKEQFMYTANQFWFEEGEDNGLFNVHFIHGGYKRSETIWYEFPNDELKDLLNYMNNPDMYKKAKKYNI